MFFHSLKYSFKTLLHSRTYLFWCLCFPLVLATLFNIAFGNLSEGESFAPIKTAVVLPEGESAEEFRKIVEELSAPGEDQFLEASFVSEEQAITLLENKEVTGILYGGEEVSLTISAEMDYDNLNQSILQEFVKQFQSNYAAVVRIAKQHPEKLAEALDALSMDTEYNKQIVYADGNMDEKLCYFFNLIAMSCLFGCTAGANVAIGNQANLSSLAMRKCISPVRKLVSLLGEVTATTILQFSFGCISVLYLWKVLNVDFGNNLGYVLLTVFVGTLTGISYGFLVGCIGKLDEFKKTGMLMGVTMLLCFLSGLMVQGMRLMVERTFPILNKINPAALISDSLYSLAVYESPARYFQNVFTLVVMSGIFCLLGVIIVRRERYASL